MRRSTALAKAIEKALADFSLDSVTASDIQNDLTAALSAYRTRPDGDKPKAKKAKAEAEATA